MESENKRPRYCGTCGRPLQISNVTVGYDVYTGEPIGSESLYCATTKVIRNGLFGVKEVSANHPSWRFNNGVWETR